MLKILIKKQLLEINRSLFFNQKTGKRRSKVTIVLFVGMFALLMLFLVGMFAAMSYTLGSALIPQGLTWLYFSVTGGIAVLFGVFGSVFNTYSTLFLSKDNDLLLSLPIPVKHILISRLLGVYIMGLLYSAMVSLPAAIMRMIIAKTAVNGVIGALLSVVLISIFVFVLSCALGYIVAKISVKLKNNGIATAAISIAFIGAYYFVYAKASEILQQFETIGAEIAEGMKIFAYPLYALGKAGEGNPIFLICVTAVILALLYLAYFLLSRSFLKVATATDARRKVIYNGKPIKQKSPFGALLKKEFKKFTSSAGYMLNCAFGSVIMIAVGIVALVALRDISNFAETSQFTLSFAPIIVVSGVMLIAAGNTITAPSVSLEGKTMWIIKSLPVDARQYFKAKVFLHVSVTLIPAAFLAICLSIALKISFVSAAISLAAIAAFVFLTAEFGLLIDIARVNLDWSNETAVIKRSFAVFIVIMAGFIYAAGIGAAGFFLEKIIPAEYVLLIIFAVNMLLLILLHICLSKDAEALLSEI